MKKKLLAGGVSATVLAVGGLPLPGCETMVFDPQAFMEANACNIFNCDTLFFLRTDRIGGSEHEDVDLHADEPVDEEPGDHMHG